jgi:O-antigen/teichoic acid export membrane protein
VTRVRKLFDRYGAQGIARLRGSVFARNVATSLNGSIIGQLLILLAVPFLARIYSPDAFALAQACTGIVATAMVVSCLRYDVALTVCDEAEIKPLLSLVLIIGTIVAGTITVGILLLPASAFESLKIEFIRPVVGWFALSIIVASAANTMFFLAIRANAFKTLAYGKVLQALAFVGLAAAIGFMSAANEGILAADIAGRTVLLVLLASSLGLTLLPGRMRDISAMLAVAKRYRDFPLVSLPGGLLNALGSSFNTIWMLALFTPQAAGSYALVERLVVAPVTLIAATFAQVYQGRLSLALLSNSGNVTRDFTKLLQGLFLVSVGPFILLFWVAPVALPAILGEQWREAGEMCRILSPSVFVIFLASPFNMILTMLQKQRVQLAWEATRFLFVTGSWLASLRAGLTAREALMLVSATGALTYLLFLAIAYGALRKLPATMRGQSPSLTAEPT